METFTQVIDAFGGTTEFAAALGIPESHARTMKARASIPAERWERVVEAAQSKGRSDITYEILAKIAARKREPVDTPPDHANGEAA